MYGGDEKGWMILGFCAIVGASALLVGVPYAIYWLFTNVSITVG